MADVGHFGCPKFTFDRISGHFRLIGYLGFPKFTFGHNFRRPFWMSENHFGSHFWPFQIDRPFWMSEIHFRWHFWPFQIHTELYFFLNLWQNGRWRPFWMSANNFRSHLWPFQIDTQLFFWIFLTKWPLLAILDGTIMSIIKLVRDIWMSNACVKFEEHILNPSKVIALTKLWRGRGGWVDDENIIFPKTYVSREYNKLRW